MRRSLLLSLGVIAFSSIGLAGTGAATMSVAAAGTSPGVGSATSSFRSAVGPPTSLPAIPPASAPLSAWQAWASAQTAAIEAVPYVKDFAAQGETVLSIRYVAVGQIPGENIPAGVTTTAAVIIVGPPQGVAAITPTQGTSAVTPNTATGSVYPPGYNYSGSCNSINQGWTCVGVANGSYGLWWQAEYDYGNPDFQNYYNLQGKLNLGVGGCPGQYAAATTGLITLEPYDSVYVEYGPVDFSQTWDSRWWEYSYPSYVSWGYACYTA